ncbi:MAG TPA: secretin N-terminal domain-containing protein, partial [Armatimonadota bacterium]|nr:secretin N-terminal domain-containing protein [Armatimonadota bacterium]
DLAYVLSQTFGTEAPQSINPFFGGFFGGQQGQNRDSRRDRRIRRRINSDKNQRSDASLGPQVASAATDMGTLFGFRPEDPRTKLLADASAKPPLPPGAEQLAQFFYDPSFGSRRRGTDATTGRTSSGQYVNLLPLRGNVIVTPERSTNSLIITTPPENERAVRDLIDQLDVEVKQVLLEAIVTEVTLDKSVRFGIDYFFKDLRNQIEGVFPVLPSTGPLGADPLTSGLRYTILRGDFRAVVTAVASDDRIRILSTPSVFTANNQEAEIDVTDSIPYLKGTTVGFGGQTTTNVDFIEVGLILNVTPRITADGMVAVDVYQEDSNLVQFRNVGNDAQAPITTQRVTDTSVTLRDGDTLVLSGLQKTSRNRVQNKIPVLGDLPLIGNLFRSVSKRDQRTELIVFLTPRVINNADEARRLSDQELQRIQKAVPNAKTRLPDVRLEAPK